MAFRPSRLVFFGLPLLLALPSKAKCEEMSSLSVSVDGSLPWQYSSNPGRTSGSKHPDHMVSPYIKLSASGNFGPDLIYQFYGSGGMDRYFDFADGNGSVAALGGQVGKKWEHLQFKMTYERGLYFDEYFRRPETVVNDLGISVQSAFGETNNGIFIRPTVLAILRADDYGLVQRTLLSARIGFEKAITVRWAAVLAPSIRYYNYQGTQAGRKDMIFAASGGAKYAITTDISWTTSVGYEIRGSNIPKQNYVNYTIGTSIDYSFDLLGQFDRKARFR